MADFKFEPDIHGIRAILHSQGVNAALEKWTQGVASACNADMESEPNTRGDGEYKAYLDNGTYTSIGVVGTHGYAAMMDQKRHHRLERFNH